MLLAALPGLAAGAVALTQLSKEALQVAVGRGGDRRGGWQLRQRRRGAAARAARRRPGLAAGFLSGVLTTSISVSGPPIVLWLEARGARPEEFRASLAASFLALNLTGGAMLIAAEGSRVGRRRRGAAAARRWSSPATRWERSPSAASTASASSRWRWRSWRHGAGERGGGLGVF